jgi:hypothetical protein
VEEGDKPGGAGGVGEAKSEGGQQAAEAPKVALKDHPKYQKYFKMKQMNLPELQVRCGDDDDDDKEEEEEEDAGGVGWYRVIFPVVSPPCPALSVPHPCPPV